jgi:sporulation protein YabP
MNKCDDKLCIKQDSSSQNIQIENRKKIVVTGVKGVENYNSQCVVVNTEKGTLYIKGRELNIKNLCLESLMLDVEGEIDGCAYSNSSKDKKSVLKGLFR